MDVVCIVEGDAGTPGSNSLRYLSICGPRHRGAQAPRIYCECGMGASHSLYKSWN
jgi:hypothetical protein